uniref:Zinc finger, CCHC-type n=1 Tax=Tanacetum cinerariifolium TaxID=118510 RepID=A0A6L2MFT6_TANCI|nr:zinc finger, CCHC-type [Tanacetum cinerariifolium]
MASTIASISKPSKRPKINIIPPKQLLIDLTNDDTKTPSPNYQVLSPSAATAPSKTPSTIATSSSSIDHKPKSPTSSTSSSTHGYLNSSMSPPPRVPPPPPTQKKNLSYSNNQTGQNGWNELYSLERKDENSVNNIQEKNNKGNDKKRNGTWNPSKDNKKDKKPLSDELHMASVITTDDWWYDSGATTHVCNNRDLFKTFKETEDGHEVMMGDNHTSKVIGSGNIEIQFTSRKKLTLMNVFHVANIRKNLVSGFKLCKNGVKAVIESDKVIMSKSNVFVGKDYDSTSTNEIVTQIPQDISGPNLNSNNKRNMTESFSAPRRSERARKERNWHPNFIDSQAIIFLVEGDNENNEAIDDEVDSLASNNTLELSDLPPGSKAIECRWVFRIKYHTDGSIQTFKASLFKCDLDKEVYMKQPEGFVLPGHKNKVCKLKKSLYGLKQALKQWHDKFDMSILSNGFTHNSSDRCIYSKFTKDYGVILCLYVDDILIVGTNMKGASWITGSSDSKFTTGWIFTLDGGVVCWGSKKQTCITHSTMEAKFLAPAVAGKESEWLRNMVSIYALNEVYLWKLKGFTYVDIRSGAAPIKSPGGSSDTSEGSENSESFEDSRRLDEEYSEDGASSKEGGSETPHNGEPESYLEALSSKDFIQWKKAIIEEMVSLEKNQMCSRKEGITKIMDVQAFVVVVVVALWIVAVCSGFEVVLLRRRLPIERLTPDEIKARSDWWVSSRAYFDGHISEAERIPRHVNRQNHYEVPSEFYREFEEQKRVVDQMMKKDVEREIMYEQVNKFMRNMKVGRMQGGPSSFQTANNSFFEGAQATHSYGHNMATPKWQIIIPSHPGTSNWQIQMPSHSATPNWKPLIPSHPHDAGLLTRIYWIEKGGKFVLECIGGLHIWICLKIQFYLRNVGMTLCFYGEHDTGNYLVYENVDPSKITFGDNQFLTYVWLAVTA